MADKTKYFDYDTVKEMLYDLEYEGKEVEPSDYPYIEIADEHGRFIDVDDAIRQLRKWGDAPIKRNNFEIADLLESIAETDTVLEANE